VRLLICLYKCTFLGCLPTCYYERRTDLVGHTYSTNSSGPRTLPWGIPLSTLVGVDTDPFTLATIVMSVRKFSIHRSSLYCCWFMCLGQHFTGYCRWFMWGLGQHILLGIVVGLCVCVCVGRGSGDTLHWVLLLVYVPLSTLYWVLLLVYVGPRATHFTGYYEGPRTTLYLGIVVGCLHQWVVSLRGALGNILCWVLLLAYVGGLGQHTLLGIVVGLCACVCGAREGWMRGTRVTHFTGYCCWLMWCLEQHFNGYCCWFMWGIVVGYVAPQATHFTGHCF
jgi:hypothetical protein